MSLRAQRGNLVPQSGFVPTRPINPTRLQSLRATHNDFGKALPTHAHPLLELVRIRIYRIEEFSGLGVLFHRKAPILLNHKIVQILLLLTFTRRKLGTREAKPNKATVLGRVKHNKDRRLLWYQMLYPTNTGRDQTTALLLRQC